MIRIRDIASHIETLAPLSYQESYDNSGLLVGQMDKEVKKILISLDVTEEVIEEAIKTKSDLIIAHHPIIFKGLKKLTGANYVERTVIKAIQNNIAIYACHTNLDNVKNGVNYKIAEKIGLKNTRILAPKSDILKKLITFIPLKDTTVVLKAIHDAGAGKIGNYSECSFQIEGIGTFKPNDEADPAIGNANILESVEEKRVEVIFPSYLETRILKALFASHPYEEPAFDIIPLSNSNKEVGSGVIGELEKPVSEEDFLKSLKNKMGVTIIRHTQLLGKKVEKLAICGGAGSFLLKDAVSQGAQVFVSADFKYHEFFDAQRDIIIADIGHYESEVYTKDLIFEHLNKKFANIALVLSDTFTNPIRYL